MELMYKWMIAFGVAVMATTIILVVSIQKKKKTDFESGIRVANTSKIRSTKLYKSLSMQYKVFRIVLAAGLIGSMLSALVLAARPYRNDDIMSGVKKRDIILCLDVSYSLYDLNSEFTDYLKGVVQGLEGDRIGISIFNTSTVTYVPLTDDYDYVLQKLDELGEYFALQKEYCVDFEEKYGYYGQIPESEQKRFDELVEKLTYFDAGTTYNSYLKGSSLIGEGLGSALFSFPYIDEPDRTRVIIMCTDNELNDYMPQIMDLDEAAKACKSHKVTIFGIYPSEDKFYLPDEYDYEECSTEFRRAVEMTGGKFYIRTPEQPVSEIVKDIQKQEAMVVKLVMARQPVDMPYVPFIICLISLAFFSLAGLVLQK
ncbi:MULTISPECIES: hypothetical protein [unclassified Butyrivibrio]|uniref:hypothetical protein n=1 Tax=unclassified Butyrivibrio TaxID=2639466 RepID=UPI0008EF2044|nr:MULTISPECIES: hypothetical protein [unclassified Butyrivibrio]RKM63367.1 hypothetical protein D6856_04390 [Butyrivibrio sp. XB500-5]SFU89672.1 hypothetical protein SAMN02910342_02269 [Butyrivibrio sp. INlla21]